MDPMNSRDVLSKNVPGVRWGQVGHVGMGWVMHGWGGVGHGGVGGSCRGGVGWS